MKQFQLCVYRTEKSYDEILYFDTYDEVQHYYLNELDWDQIIIIKVEDLELEAHRRELIDKKLDRMSDQEYMDYVGSCHQEDLAFERAAEWR